MSQLHVFSSTQSFQRGTAILAKLQPHDSVLLRADALYHLLSAEDFAAGSYAIKDDALARGLDPQQFPHIEWIDYAQWVTLAVEHDCSVTW